MGGLIMWKRRKEMYSYGASKKDKVLDVIGMIMMVVWVAGIAIFIGTTFTLGAWIALLIIGF
jgi:hypothetical protein